VLLTRLIVRLRLMLRLAVLRLVLLRLILLRLILLRLMLLGLILLGLILLRIAWIERLRLTGRERFAADVRLFVVVVIAVIAGIAAPITALTPLLLKIGLSLAELFLRGGDQAEIMFGMLIIILGGDRITGTLRVTGQLQIFLGDVGRRAPDFYVLTV